MSRSIDKHPGKVCPRGRRRCGVCQLGGGVKQRRRALAAAVFPNELDADVHEWNFMRIWRWDPHHRVWRPAEVEDHDFTDEDVAARGPDVVQAWPDSGQPLGNDAECNGSGRVAGAAQVGGA